VIEFFNIVAAMVCGFILGLTVHSAYVHSKGRGSLKPAPWDHDEEERRLE